MRVIFSLVVACLLAAFSPPSPASDDLSILLDGVNRITSGGLPGPVVAYGPEAFPVVTPDGSAAVVAAARWGRGRVVVFGHGGFRGESRFDTPRLLANSGAWAARKGDDGQPMRVWGASQQMLDALTTQGVVHEAVGGSWSDRLDTIDLLLLDTHQITSEEDQRQVSAFVHDRGGGLLTSGLAWGWLQLNPTKGIEDHPGSRLLRDAGIAFADGTLPKDNQDGYTVEQPSDAAHAMRALEIIAAAPSASTGNAASAIALALRTLGNSDPVVRDHLRALLADHPGGLDSVYKSMGERGLTWERDALARLGIELFMLEGFAAPPEQIEAHPSFVAFPGALPSDAQRLTVRRSIDTTIPGWRCTGLFVPAGKIVTLRFDRDWKDSGLVVQIGSHLDPASRGQLKRLPGVVRRFAVDQQTIRVAHAVGGLLYLDVPAGFAEPSIAFEAQGVVAAPHFVLGETTPEQWQSLRNAPAPWAELESREIALTLPSDVVRELDDPQALMEFWDRVVQAQGSLEPRKPSGMPDRQARFVPDVQVSWGYMYAPADRPLTVPLHSAKNMVDLHGLSTNTGGNIWGFFHELGHWHQNPMWTFEGTGEVTVNLFTLYALDAVCGLAPAESRGFTPEKLLNQMREHAQRGAPFDRWKRDPFLALAMYVQMQQAFGWDLYRDVFAEYRSLPDAQRPRNDGQKRDQWLVRLSRRASHNLGPFFEAWGVPNSDEARASIRDLPVWMPEGWDASF